MRLIISNKWLPDLSNCSVSKVLDEEFNSGHINLPEGPKLVSIWVENKDTIHLAIHGLKNSQCTVMHKQVTIGKEATS